MAISPILRVLLDDPDFIVHLRRSGITDDTAVLAQIAPADPREMPQAVTHIKGLKFPFFDEQGDVIPGAFRIRLLHNSTPKYYQPEQSEQHVYLPPIIKP